MNQKAPRGLGNLYSSRYFHYNNQLASRIPQLSGMLAHLAPRVSMPSPIRGFGSLRRF